MKNEVKIIFEYIFVVTGPNQHHHIILSRHALIFAYLTTRCINKLDSRLNAKSEN
jgi:hypothetical protein